MGTFVADPHFSVHGVHFRGFKIMEAFPECLAPIPAKLHFGSDVVRVMQSGMGCSIRMMWQTAQDEKVKGFCFFSSITPIVGSSGALP